MLEMNVLRALWVVLSLAGGTVVTLAIVMSYMALWQPRDQEYRGPAWMKRFADFPWVLIFSIVGGVLFMITYIVIKIIYPPHW